MRFVIGIFAVLMFVMGCGSEEENPNEKAERAWSEMSSEDQANLCDGYYLLGAQWIEDILTDLARTHSDVVVQQEIDAYTDVVVRECLDRV